MAGATSDGLITLELHGFLADRLSELGRRRGTRTIVSVPLDPEASVATLLSGLVAADARYGLLFELDARRLPEHVEAVLNDRVLDLQGGLDAPLHAGDVLAFLPAHAGGTNKQIARRLRITLGTVEHYVQQILEKTGLPGRVAIATEARASVR